MATGIGMILVWALGLVALIFIIGAGVRVGMRWSRIDERKEQAARTARAQSTHHHESSSPDDLT